MLKALSERYYLLLFVAIICFVINLQPREAIIGYIFNTSNDESVTDANAYASETYVRNVFSAINLVVMIITLLASVILVYFEKSDSIKRLIQVAVIIAIASLFTLGIITGSL